MSSIKLNHWFVEENEMCISLTNFFVRLSYNEESKKIVTAIINNNKGSLFFTFDTLEEAISFVENTVDNCFNIDEIKDIYMSSYLKLTKNK